MDTPMRVIDTSRQSPVDAPLDKAGRSGNVDVWLFAGLTVMLSFATYWLPLLRGVLPFVIVLIPALLAIVFTAGRGGWEGVVALLSRKGLWRVNLKWLAIALLLTLTLRLAMSVVALWLGLIAAIQLRPLGFSGLLMLATILLVAALCEELGWRRYALPKLLAMHSPLVAALVIGVLWGTLHLALLLPGMMNEGISPIATMLYLLGLSILITWFFVNSGGSVLLVAIFHAAQSFFAIVNEGITPLTS